MTSDINLADVLTEITVEFLRYEDALVNNRVNVLDELFWDDTRTIRYGVTENLYGYDAIQAFRSNRRAIGLDRTLRNTVLTTFGRDFATACTEFTRPNNEKIGRQTQTWVRTIKGWKIVSAHVSFCEVGVVSHPCSRAEPD